MQAFTQLQQGQQGLHGGGGAAQRGRADQAAQGQFLVLGSRVSWDVMPLKQARVERARLRALQGVAPGNRCMDFRVFIFR